MAFNAYCDDIVRKVNAKNLEKSYSAIRKKADSLNKLFKNADEEIITDYYIQLKYNEAHLAYRFAAAKEEEKEAIRAAREQEREERKAQKELEAEKKRLEKEKLHYSAALETIKLQLLTCDEDKAESLKEKEQTITSHLEEVDKAIANVDYREANIKAGYVYIISNIGSFGENVYKIGMTRRLDPMDRIRELGDASVPFAFDVHALIFSDNAPQLEAKLHQEFADRRVNMVNNRREFFSCSLDEIKHVIEKSYDKTVEFIDEPQAVQFKESEKLKGQIPV